MRRLLAVLALGLGLAGCASPKMPDYTPAAPRLFVETAAEGGVVVTLPQSGVHIAVGAKPVITEFDLAEVEVARVELGDCLLLRLKPAAARDLYRLSVANQGRRLVLAINGEALGARRIDRPLSEGVALFFVELPDAELPALAEAIRRTAADAQRKLED